jgi:hypothetical protein
MTTKNPDPEVSVCPETAAQVAFEMAKHLFTFEEETRDEFLELYIKCFEAVQG